LKEAEMSERLPNIHPGEVLLEEFLKPMGISQYRLARDTGIAPMRVSEIVRGKRAVTADTALRLARYFGTSVKFWMGLQDDYEIEQARQKLADRLEREVRPLAA
jgi:addiction module HigA family antidote